MSCQVTFECLSELKDDLEWKVVYVGSAEDDQHDQELENVFVGPVPVGTNKFVLQVRTVHLNGFASRRPSVFSFSLPPHGNADSTA